jgi:hypothetical protein
MALILVFAAGCTTPSAAPEAVSGGAVLKSRPIFSLIEKPTPVEVPPEDRPEYFSLEDAGEYYRYDEAAMGLTVPARGSWAWRGLEGKGKRGKRQVFSADRIGHSNRGHSFGTELTADEKGAVIEYLKTL